MAAFPLVPGDGRRSGVEPTPGHHIKLRTKVILVTVPLLIVITAPIAFFGLWFAAFAGSDEGSPGLAREWRDELDKYKSPDEVDAVVSTIEVVEFENGEWLFGRAQNSHGIWRRGGGTVVVKDSNGGMRAFLGGHVCGDGFLSWGFGETVNLDSFYDRVAEHGFQEYNFDARQRVAMEEAINVDERGFQKYNFD